MATERVKSVVFGYMARAETTTDLIADECEVRVQNAARAKQPKYNWGGMFVDDYDESMPLIVKRPAFQVMFGQAKAGDFVIIPGLEYFGWNNTVDALVFCLTLLNRGCHIHSVSGGVTLRQDEQAHRFLRMLGAARALRTKRQGSSKFRQESGAALTSLVRNHHIARQIVDDYRAILDVADRQPHVQQKRIRKIAARLIKHPKTPAAFTVLTPEQATDLRALAAVMKMAPEEYCRYVVLAKLESVRADYERELELYRQYYPTGDVPKYVRQRAIRKAAFRNRLPHPKQEHPPAG